MAALHQKAFLASIGSGSAHPYQSGKLARHARARVQNEAWGVDTEVDSSMGETMNKTFDYIEKRRLEKAAKPYWNKRRQCWVTPHTNKSTTCQTPSRQTWPSARGGGSSRKANVTAHIFEDKPDMNVTLGYYRCSRIYVYNFGSDRCFLNFCRYDNHAARMTMGIMGNNHTTRKHLDLWLRKEKQAQERRAAARKVDRLVEEVDGKLSMREKGREKGPALEERPRAEGRTALIDRRSSSVPTGRRTGRGGTSGGTSTGRGRPQDGGRSTEVPQDGGRSTELAAVTQRRRPTCSVDGQGAMTQRTAASITRIRTSNIGKYSIGQKIRTPEVRSSHAAHVCSPCMQRVYVARACSACICSACM
jgi:hypothetical protein